MKPEFILAVDQSLIANTFKLTQGVYPVSLDFFAEHASPHLAIRQREALEGNPNYRQLLPYVAITQRGEDDQVRFYPYQRGKGVGESRLAGNVSVGFGGHIDMADIKFEDNVLQLVKTVGTAVVRELSEECQFHPGQANLGMYDVGVIVDSSNDVGKVHLGFLMNIDLPAGASVTCKEAELEMLAPMTAQELLDSGLPLENWTRMTLEFFLESERDAANAKLAEEIL